MSPWFAVLMGIHLLLFSRMRVRVELVEPLVLPPGEPKAVEGEHGQPVAESEQRQRGQPEAQPEDYRVDDDTRAAERGIHRAAGAIHPDVEGVSLECALVGDDLADAAGSVRKQPGRVGGPAVAADPGARVRRDVRSV